ncbi:hypothetical protein MACH21_33980 [Roseicyclus marinus]|uniref:Secreted protein n=1 Tax=Roseicyclus marinus TaxID=2161673 RepID=A0AA48HW54_9RHOB|nr:hypothetical protein MACH21_33980 [Roseicyclus marinus]
MFTDFRVCNATMALLLVRMLDIFVPFHVQGADSAPVAWGRRTAPWECPSDTCGPVIRATPPVGVLRPIWDAALKNVLIAR